jgi:hypothetical protein
MFRTLARLLNDPELRDPTAQLSQRVFLIHPLQLSRWLEQAWAFAGTVTWANLPNNEPFLGAAGIVEALELPDTPQPLRNDLLGSGIHGDPRADVDPLAIAQFFPPPAPGQTVAGLPWDHLFYALLVENTGVYEILSEVVRRYAVGETLEAPSLETLRWLRATEELFFRDPPLFHITGITSRFWPDPRVARRNTFYRLFGMDLAHPLPPTYPLPPGGEQPWKRDVGAANERFREIWTSLLSQVWLAMENVQNTSGANPTDATYVAELCRVLHDMLNIRRRNGQLAREEFVHVATMSWFHLTVDSNTPIVVDLKAQASDPADRLAKIGQRVGITPPRQAREYFELAELTSMVLRFIELGQFDTATAAQTLFLPGTTISSDMNRIIDLWQSATGDRIKDLAVRVARQPRMAGQPQFLPSGPTDRGPVAANGRGLR